MLEIQTVHVSLIKLDICSPIFYRGLPMPMLTYLDIYKKLQIEIHA